MVLTCFSFSILVMTFCKARMTCADVYVSFAALACTSMMWWDSWKGFWLQQYCANAVSTFFVFKVRFSVDGASSTLREDMPLLLQKIRKKFVVYVECSLLIVSRVKSFLVFLTMIYFCPTCWLSFYVTWLQVQNELQQKNWRWKRWGKEQQAWNVVRVWATLF